MTKTAFSISPRRRKVEITLSAAAVAALASLTTAESIDISSIVKNVSAGEISRTVNREYVTGDNEAIIDLDTRIERGPVVITCLYTNGKEVLGTDDLDPYDVIKEFAEYDGELSLPVIDSPAGGNSGDQEFASGAADSFVSNVSALEGGADTDGRVQFSFRVDSSSWTPATVA
jgi:hypothetical protein